MDRVPLVLDAVDEMFESPGDHDRQVAPTRSPLVRRGYWACCVGLAVTLLGIVVLQQDNRNLELVGEGIHRTGQLVMLFALGTVLIGYRTPQIKRALEASRARREALLASVGSEPSQSEPRQGIRPARQPALLLIIVVLILIGLLSFSPLPVVVLFTVFSAVATAMLILVHFNR